MLSIQTNINVNIVNLWYHALPIISSPKIDSYLC